MNTILNRAALTAVAASLTLAGVAVAQSDMGGNGAGGTTPPAQPMTPAGGGMSGGMSDSGSSGGMSGQMKMSPEDAKKMTEAYLREEQSQNLLEQKLGKLAQKSDDPQLKQFGQMIEQNHDQDEQNVKQAADSAGVSLTGEMSQMDSAKYDQLSKLSGKMFDMQYAYQEVGGHITDILADKCMAMQASDQAVKDYAKTAVQQQQKHLQMISRIASNYAGVSSVQSVMGGSGSTGGDMGGMSQPAGMSQPGSAGSPGGAMDNGGTGGMGK